MKNTTVQLNENHRIAIDIYNYMLQKRGPKDSKWRTLWYYTDLKNACERILTDAIRIDGYIGSRI